MSRRCNHARERDLSCRSFVCVFVYVCFDFYHLASVCFVSCGVKRLCGGRWVSWQMIWFGDGRLFYEQWQQTTGTTIPVQVYIGHNQQPSDKRWGNTKKKKKVRWQLLYNSLLNKIQRQSKKFGGGWWFPRSRVCPVPRCTRIIACDRDSFGLFAMRVCDECDRCWCGRSIWWTSLRKKNFAGDRIDEAGAVCRKRSSEVFFREQTHSSCSSTVMGESMSAVDGYDRWSS